MLVFNYCEDASEKTLPILPVGGADLNEGKEGEPNRLPNPCLSGLLLIWPRVD